MKCFFYFKIIITLILFTHQLNAQNSDLLRLEFTYFPQESSDNSFRRIRSFINYPIKLKNGDYLLPGVEYRNVNLIFNDSAPFKTDELDRFQSLEAKLAYIHKINDNWRFAAELGTQAASNFTSNKLLSDDLLLTASAFLIHKKEFKNSNKKRRILFGLRYSTTTGFPFPLPIFLLNKRINQKFSYNLGVPKTSLKYYFNEKSSIQSFITLDGFYANIQKDIPVVNNQETDIASDITMTVVLGGLGYQYKFTDKLIFYIYSGYTLLNDIRLRNSDRDDIFTINDNNSFYGRTGIKFKF